MWGLRVGRETPPHHNPAHPGAAPPGRAPAPSRPTRRPRYLGTLEARRRLWVPPGGRGWRGLCKAAGTAPTPPRPADPALSHLGRLPRWHPGPPSPLGHLAPRPAAAALRGGDCGSLPILAASRTVLQAGPQRLGGSRESWTASLLPLGCHPLARGARAGTPVLGPGPCVPSAYGLALLFTGPEGSPFLGACPGLTSGIRGDASGVIFSKWTPSPGKVSGGVKGQPFLIATFSSQVMETQIPSAGSADITNHTWLGVLSCRLHKDSPSLLQPSSARSPLEAPG
ncbi:uncharacterized protein LOC118146085 [Callithrix jacchus]